MSPAPAASSRGGLAAMVLARLTPRQSLAAGALALIGTVLAYCYMSLRGDETTGLVVLATPVIGTLFAHGGLKQVTAEQDESIAMTVHGAIADLVPGIVHAVLDERAAQAAEREPAA